MSNLHDDVERLERELANKKSQLKREQENCSHHWGETKYDPEKYKEPVYSQLEGRGSDPFPVYNYVDRTRDRWSRTCQKCNKTEYTSEQKAVKYEPKFD
jgi:hypothetical protein